MTTVYRRVTDLSTDGLARAVGERLGRDLTDCATTDAALDRAQPYELAVALAAAGTPRRVAIISEAQADEIRERGHRAWPILAMRKGTRELASRWPLALYKRGHGDTAEHVIWLEADGQVPRLGTRTGMRQRVHVRWTIGADVVERVRAEASRRGVSASAVVEEALRDLAGR